MKTQVLITMVLLASWLEPTGVTSGDWDVVDLFAGAGRIARLARMTGQKSVALDILYSQNPHSFDINEDAGFAFLDLVFTCQPTIIEMKD